MTGQQSGRNRADTGHKPGRTGQMKTTTGTGRPMRILITLALVAGLAGCATVDGIGRDISGAARGVQSWF